MSFDQDFKKKSYAIYGLGLTGHSTLNFLKKVGLKIFFCGMIILKREKILR